MCAHAAWQACCAQAAIELLVGDVLLACATLTYCGAMPHDRRVKLVQSWQQECQSRDIVTSQPFTVAGVLSKPTEVRLAHTHRDGLPAQAPHLCQHRLLTSRPRTHTVLSRMRAAP